MKIHIRHYCEEEDHAIWDQFCTESLQATFLHTRRFLSYHGSRFNDRSIIIESDSEWLGVFPAAESTINSSVIISHPGITYGGIVHKGKLKGIEMIRAMSLISDHYRSHGYKRLIYKAVPILYHQAPVQDDLYALYRLGAVRIRADLSCAIDLNNRLAISQRRRRALNKAKRNNIVIEEGKKNMPELWDILSRNLKEKHNAHPTHTLDEINLLSNLFPNEIVFIHAIYDDRVVAGVVLFETPTCSHAQYITSTSEGEKLAALDYVFDYCINRKYKEDKRWFDFGICNEQDGWYLNETLYKYKSEFGGGGIVHEFYEIDLVQF
ncbi:GNAT family N-acetyltransferase [Aeromonas schubertii]|uniref:GNAT family N-acetyltransferase n=1 Tax=Aeromonas schubertii TaxID=652 RepID=UPI0038B50713